MSLKQIIKNREIIFKEDNTKMKNYIIMQIMSIVSSQGP